MITLKVEKRNPEVKAKKLRRDGFVCGVAYGKRNEGVYSHSAHGAGSPPLYQSQQEGTQVMLDLDGKQVDALCKKYRL